MPAKTKGSTKPNAFGTPAMHEVVTEGAEHAGQLRVRGKEFGLSRMDMVVDAFNFYREHALSDPDYEPEAAKVKREAAEAKLAEKQAKALEIQKKTDAANATAAKKKTKTTVGKKKPAKTKPKA